MRSVFFIPPLNKMSGGLANIYDVASLLAGAGHEVALCHMEKGAPGLEDMRGTGLAVQGWDECKLSRGDIWCIPEGWPNSIAKGFDAGARTVVYAQNWVYMLGVLPDDIRWKSLPLEYIAVSEPVGWFMRDVLGLKVKAALPPVVRECYYREGTRPKNIVRVAWMPRKNGAMARQIQLTAVEFLRRDAAAPPVEWVEINNMSQEEVAVALASCHIFVMSSMAEGFGLPPVEAMASGCIPVGFAGLGGWEYMRSTPLSPCHNQVTSSLPPGLTLADKPWGPNGFYAPEGDVISAGMALAAAVRLAAADAPEWGALQREACKTAQAYSRKAMRRRLPEVWNW